MLKSYTSPCCPAQSVSVQERPRFQPGSWDEDAVAAERGILTCRVRDPWASGRAWVGTSACLCLCLCVAHDAWSA